MEKKLTYLSLSALIVALTAVLLVFSPATTVGQSDRGQCEQQCTSAYQQCRREANANQDNCQQTMRACRDACWSLARLRWSTSAREAEAKPSASAPMTTSSVIITIRSSIRV